MRTARGIPAHTGNESYPVRHMITWHAKGTRVMEVPCSCGNAGPHSTLRD